MRKIRKEVYSMKTIALLKELRKNHNRHAHCQLHTLRNNHSLGQDLMWLFSAQTIIHCMIHLVSFIPILFGLADWEHHHNHTVEIGKMVSYSFTLNFILHIGMAAMLVIAQKLRNK